MWQNRVYQASGRRRKPLGSSSVNRLLVGMGSLFCLRFLGLWPTLFSQHLLWLFVRPCCSCGRTLIHLFSVELHLSPLPSTFGSSCRTPLVSLNLLNGTEISLPPVQPVFPVSISAGFSMCSMVMSGCNLGLQLIHIQI